MTDHTPTLTLARGRRVTLLPRTGGHSWAGTVDAWESADGKVVARVNAGADAIGSLDHHLVYLSTITRGDEHGVTVFAGRAFADGGALRVEGVVRLAEEKRRRSLRACGGVVALPDTGGSERRLVTLDISRGAVRLPVGEGGWTYADPIDLVVHLRDTKLINALGWLLRIDVETKSVVLGFDDLATHDAEAIDRFALAQLAAPDGGSTG